MWNFDLKATNDMKPIDTDTVRWLPERRGLVVENGKGVKCMVREDDLLLGGGHTMQYADRVSSNLYLKPT